MGKHKSFLRLVTILWLMNCTENRPPIINRTMPKPETSGKDFLLGFPQNGNHSSGKFPEHLISYFNARDVTEVDIQMLPDKSVVIGNITGGNNFYEYDHQVYALTGNKMAKNGIQITSYDKEIWVHVFQYRMGSAEGYMNLPVHHLSKEYIIASFFEHRELAVVSLYDSTSVAITFRTEPESPVRYRNRSYPNGSTLYLSLGKLDTFHLQHRSNLTGTIVQSTNDVAVISGSTCSSGPTKTKRCVFLSEQMLPLKYWGTEFIVPMLFKDKAYIVQFVAGFDNTSFSIMKEPKVLNRGEHWYSELQNPDSIYVHSSKPLLVVQYGEGNTFMNGSGDRFMLQVPAISQYTTDYAFTAMTHIQNHIVIIVKSQDTTGLLLDGKRINSVDTAGLFADGKSADPEDTADIQDRHVQILKAEIIHTYNGTEYIVLTLTVEPGLHFLNHSSKGVVFGAIYVGYDSFQSSIGYPLALKLTNTSDPINDFPKAPLGRQGKPEDGVWEIPVGIGFIGILMFIGILVIVKRRRGRKNENSMKSAKKDYVQILGKDEPNNPETPSGILSYLGLSYISKNLGKEWTQVVLYLNVPQAIIEQIQLANPGFIQLQIQGALMTWRDNSQKSDGQKIHELMEALEFVGRT